jgi:hypothetical protein
MDRKASAGINEADAILQGTRPRPYVETKRHQERTCCSELSAGRVKGITVRFMIATSMLPGTFSVWDVRRFQKEAPATPRERLAAGEDVTTGANFGPSSYVDPTGSTARKPGRSISRPRYKSGRPVIAEYVRNQRKVAPPPRPERRGFRRGS